MAAPLQEVQLEVVPVALRNQQVNLSAVVLPADAPLTVFSWWIGDQLQVSCSCGGCPNAPTNAAFAPQPTLTLRSSLLTRLPHAGQVSVTVQASNGRSMVQDTRTVRVYGNPPSLARPPARSPGAADPGPGCPHPDHFQVIPLSFSRNLDRLNPNVPEWREDVAQLLTKILSKVRDAAAGSEGRVRGQRAGSGSDIGSEVRGQGQRVELEVRVWV